MTDSASPSFKGTISYDWQLAFTDRFRKLERFGELLVDRPIRRVDASRPPIVGGPAADLVFDGRWHARTSAAARAVVDGWTMSVTAQDGPGRENVHRDSPQSSRSGQIVLRASDAGHVGCFPEHWAACDRVIRRQADRRTSSQGDRRALHLFAYTGTVSLQLAVAGYSVTHVDAARSAVAWARSNAESCQSVGEVLTRIRWIVEDVRKYVQRLVKRGETFDLVVLDPPSAGHGPAGRWQLDIDLPNLFDSVRNLLGDDAAVLWTGHSPQRDVQRVLESPQLQQLGQRFGRPKNWRMTLRPQRGPAIDAGYAFLWTRD